MEVRAIRPNDGHSVQLGGISARVLLSGDDCGGSLAIVEAPIAPRVLAGPLHTHHNEDALWLVLEGELGAQVGDREFHEGPGSLVLAPKGIPHTYWNPGKTPAKYLEMAWPAGLERFLMRLGHVVEEGADDVLDQVEHLSQAFGITMDWDSIAALTERHGVSLEVGT
jgi:mannose-6-phosphate isomerase-like protein (cupin superfamily)